jgi:hypothetical protein
MSLDRQSAAVADRRRAEPTINAIRPASAAAPSRIHSQRRLVPELVVAALGDVVGVGVLVSVAVAVTVAVLVTVGVGVGVLVTVAVAVLVKVGVLGAVEVVVASGTPVAVAVLLFTLLITLEAVLPHPAARHPVSRMTAIRHSPFVERHMSVLPASVTVSRRSHQTLRQ